MEFSDTYRFSQPQNNLYKSLDRAEPNIKDESKNPFQQERRKSKKEHQLLKKYRVHNYKRKRLHKLLC